MPAVPRAVLERALLSAIAESGGIGLLEPSSGRYPLRFLISFKDASIGLWVYIWTLTHGGRRSLPDEYRIRMTSVAPPLKHNRQGMTVLVGFEPNLRVFAGFDLTRHSAFTKGSSSVQIGMQALHDALQYGLGFNRKSNDEIAVGIRYDHFLLYCQHAQELHRYGTTGPLLQVLTRATKLEQVTQADMAPIARERRRFVRETAQWARAANFRLKVLQAYDYRCAVTRWQLELVEAAHILPVSAGPESIDDVRNGLALSPTYHRAFDRGLIYLDEDLRMHVNRQRVEEIRESRRDGGLAALESSLGRIHLPQDRRQWPDPAFIHRANVFRGII